MEEYKAYDRYNSWNESEIAEMEAKLKKYCYDTISGASKSKKLLERYFPLPPALVLRAEP